MLLALLAACTRAVPQPSEPTGDLPAMLESIRSEAGLPALGLAVLSGGKIVGLAAAGRRHADKTDPVTLEDPWHLGSDTKAMTATLLALLAEQGTLRWETTLAEAFPDLAVHSDLREVTLSQLVTHQGGMPTDLLALPELWEPLWEPGDPRAQRATLAAALLTRPPQEKPGGAAAYSNAGYMVLGAAMERATDTPWETLITERLFVPLGMSDCAFGPPARSRPGPWGHRTGRDGHLVPVAPDEPGADNPPALGPAGTVHCPLRDWARFVSAHLAGARGDGSLLQAASWERLHQPPAGQAYAGGWVVVERDWSAGPALTHNGSNTLFYATVWMAPGRNAAWLAVTNAAGEAARGALDQAVAQTLSLP